MSVTIEEIFRAALDLTLDTIGTAAEALAPGMAYRFCDAAGLPPATGVPEWSEQVAAMRQQMETASDPAQYAQIAKTAFTVLGAINGALSGSGPSDPYDSAFRAIMPILLAVLQKKRSTHQEGSISLILYWVVAGIVLADQRAQDSYPQGFVEYRWLAILRDLFVAAGWIQEKKNSDGTTSESKDWAPITGDILVAIMALVYFVPKQLRPDFELKFWPERSKRWVYFTYGFDHPPVPGFETQRQLAQRAITLSFPPPTPDFDASAFDKIQPQRPTGPDPLWQITMVPVPMALDPAGKGELFLQVEGAYPVVKEIGNGWKFELDASPSFGVLISKDNVTPIGDVGFQVELSHEWPDDPNAAGSGITFRATKLGIGAQVSLEDLAAWLTVEKGEITINGGHWLFDYLPKIRLTFDVTAQAAVRDGIRFKGGAGADLLIPLNLRVDIYILAFAIEAIRLRGLFSTDNQSTGLAIEASANLSLELFKILTIRVTGLGISYGSGTAPQGDGNLAGVFQLGWNPLLPSGASVEISAWVITGGGGVFYDAKKDEVSGAVELDIAVGPNKKISLKGIGLYQRATAVAVKSWLLVVTVEQPWEFPGVTLEGIGLLYGSNRKTSSDAFLAAIGNGNLSALLFGGDVIKNAPSFIAALEVLFPGQKDAHVLGILANFTALASRLTLALGVLFEYQGSSLTQVYIIGRLTAVFNPIKAGVKPDPDNLPVYVLADGVALWNCATDTLDLRIQIRNSHVWGGSLTGGASVFHGSPQNDNTKHGCYFSAGGYHPDYTPPPGLFVPQRLTVVVNRGDHLKLQAYLYLAATPSGLQFGFGGSLEAHFYGFGVRGAVSIDVLIACDGKFTVSIAASVELLLGSETLMSVSLKGKLAAWSPTVLSGKVEVQFLFWTLSKSGSYTIQGSSDDEAEAQPDVAAALITAISDSTNWEKPGVPGLTLLDVPRDGIWLSPSGPLRFHQTVVPLNVTIERFGSVQLDTPATLSIDAVNAGAGALSRTFVQEDFALGMFLNLTQEEMLAGRGFEARDAGVEVVHPLAAGQVMTGSLDFEEIMSDPLAPPPVTTPHVRPLSQIILQMMTVFTTASPPPRPVTVLRERFTVVDSSLQPQLVAKTIFEARPALRPGYRLVPEAEVA